MELVVAKEVMPNIEFNKEEIKANLAVELHKYQNLVVTTDTEKECKKDKAKLNKIRGTIEDFRKAKKKEMSAPITVFENDCKELVGLIDETIKPIDAGLKEIEEQRKNEKTEKIIEEIKKTIVEFGLDEKHGAQLSINASYLNKTTSMNKVVTDLQERAETLKKAQSALAAGKELIIQTIEQHNKQLKAKHAVDPWLEMLKQNYEVSYIIGKINERCFAELQAQMREEQEKALEEQVVGVAQEETMSEPNELETTNLNEGVTEESFSEDSFADGLDTETVFDDGVAPTKMFDCGGDGIEFQAFNATILIRIGDEAIQLDDEGIEEFIKNIRKIQEKMRG